MKNYFIYSYLLSIGIIILISSIIIPSIIQSFNEQGVIINLVSSYASPQTLFNESDNDFIWPTPNYDTITSEFGYRKSPTKGASSYHGGIDIGAPQGSKIIAIQSGIISQSGWNGGNGYSVTIDHQNGYKSMYGHVDPNLIVSVGDVISQGDTIAYVGPKYVEKKSYTTYTDSTGKTTNGATTGPHLHFAVTYNDKKINPKDLF